MNYSSYYFTTSTPYDNYNETEDYIVFSFNTGSVGSLLFSDLLTTINTDISLNIVIVGGGGGAAISSAGDEDDPQSWGSSAGGGGAGFGKLTIKNINSYQYTFWVLSQ